MSGACRPCAKALVAARAGYANPAAFAAMFERALGVPPSRFARGA